LEFYQFFVGLDWATMGQKLMRYNGLQLPAVNETEFRLPQESLHHLENVHGEEADEARRGNYHIAIEGQG